MFHASVPIGIAQAGDGIVLSLPRHFWLVVSLHRSFRGVAAEPEAWTYRVPGPGAALKVERWIAEVELRLRAEGRRRAWTASDAEWLGVAAPSAPPVAPPVIGPAFAFTLPPKGVAKATIRLLERMAEGEALVASYAAGEGRSFALGGRPIRTSVVERALEGGFVVPAGDSLFGPEFSQTWRLAPEAPAP